MPKNSISDWSTTAGDNTDIGGVSIVGTAPPSNLDDGVREIMAQVAEYIGTPALARTSFELDKKAVYAAKAANYTALAADNNAVLRFTAAATLSLTAAATLAANWHITVIADGGAVTIDPDGTETVNGLATMIVPDGTSAEIVCNGSAFFTIIRPSGWQTIEHRSFSAVSNVDFTNLGWARSLRIRGRVSFSGSTDWYWRSSTDNGSNYDAGASDYSSQILSAVGSATGAERQTAATYARISNGHTAVIVDILMNGFNVSGEGASSISKVTCFSGGADTIFTQQSSQFRDGTTARNALRFAPVSAVTMTGYLTIEGSVS